MSLTFKDKAFIATASSLSTGLSLLAWRIAGDWALIISLGLLGVFVLATQLETYRRMQDALRHYHGAPTVNYSQVESLLSMFAALPIDHPLPPMRAAAISPDFAITLIGLIREAKPRTIVEGGSGVSTVIMAYCLRQLGAGHILSLEQDPTFARITRRNLTVRGLQDLATVIDAPIKSVTLNEQCWPWYDTASLGNLRQVDMLIVDGPVQQNQETRLVRNPACPLLFDKLSREAIIVLDDADREDEKRVVQRWLKEFDGFELERLPSEKGTAILRRLR